MGTESTIVIQARKALNKKIDIDIKVPEWVEYIWFKFMDGVEAKNPKEWISLCRERKIKDIKMSRHFDNMGTDPYMTVSETCYIVCIWSDRSVTKFDRRQTCVDGKHRIEYQESEYVEDISDLYDIHDGIEEYKKNLLGLKDLAYKVGIGGECKYFARSFDMAYKILNGETTPDHSNAPYYLQDLPDRMKDMMLAKQYSYVFGGMGAWNDDPRGMAEMMGLEEEYRRLTVGLMVDMSNTEFYVTNECWT